MKQLQISLLIIVVFLATGCPKYKPDVKFDNPNLLTSRINTFLAAETTKYFEALPNSPENAKTIRNELIEKAIPFMDDAYMNFITDIQRGRDRDNYIMDLVELGTSAAVGIVKGERALHILGVSLTAFRGGRRSMDVNFYKDQATPILISKMDGNRAKVRATILTREKGSAADYPLGAAIGDLVDYYNAGTLIRAFTELQKDTAVKTSESEQAVLDLKGVRITPETTKEARDLAVTASNFLTKLEQDLMGTDAGKKAVATRRLQQIIKVLEADSKVKETLKKQSVSSTDDGVTLNEALIEIRRAARLLDDTETLTRVNQAIVDNKEKPDPTPTPTPRPTSSPSPSPTATPTSSPTL